MKKKIKYVIFIVLVVIGIILYMHYKPDHKGLNYATTIDYELSGGEQNFLVKDIEVYGIETINID